MYFGKKINLTAAVLEAQTEVRRMLSVLTECPVEFVGNLSITNKQIKRKYSTGDRIIEFEGKYNKGLTPFTVSIHLQFTGRTDIGNGWCAYDAELTIDKSSARPEHYHAQWQYLDTDDYVPRVCISPQGPARYFITGTNFMDRETRLMGVVQD